MRWLALSLSLSTALGCGRIGFDDAASDGAVGDTGAGTSDAAAGDGGMLDAAVDSGLTPASICFAPRVDLVPCVASARCMEPDPVSVAVGDLDGDGDLDVVMGEDGNGLIAVHLNGGDGTLAAPVTYPMNWDAVEVAIVEIDGDGVLDVVAASWNDRLQTFHGRGDGTLDAAVDVLGPSTPVTFDVADLDGDGDPDLVVGGEDNQIRVLYGAGDGTFAAPITLIDFENYYSVEVADLNGDGRPDIVATDWGSSASNLNVLLQDSGGGRWSNATYPLGAETIGLATGDFDQDGDIDVAAASRGDQRVQIMLNDGTGTSFVMHDFPVVPRPIWLTAADLDSDGRLDLVVSHADGGMLSILRGTPTALFELAAEIPLDQSGSGGSLFNLAKSAVGDLDADGRPDIVAANPAGQNLAVLFGAPCGG